MVLLLAQSANSVTPSIKKYRSAEDNHADRLTRVIESYKQGTKLLWCLARTEGMICVPLPHQT